MPDKRPAETARSRTVDVHERGVSETVGFILVFALVISSVGLVYTVGMSGLQDTRDVERVNNAERAFDVLAENIEDLSSRGATSRATEFKLAESSLHFGEPVQVNVTGARAGDPNDNFSGEYDVRPIVYDGGTGTQIVYTGGAIIREQRGGHVLVRRPQMVIDSRHVMLPIVQTRAADEDSISGTTTVLIRTRHSTTDYLASESETGATYDLTVNMTTPRADAWRAEFERRPGVSCPPARNTPTSVSCDVSGVDRVYVTIVRIDVAFE
ncbi:MAG: DUF7289 family protein [Halobacteriota archaeon]